MANSWHWCLSLGVQGGLEKQGAERNEVERRKLAEKEKGEVWQLPKETEIWGRQRCLKGIFRKLHSQMRFVISILWPPLNLQ